MDIMGCCVVTELAALRARMINKRFMYLLILWGCVLMVVAFQLVLNFKMSRSHPNKALYTDLSSHPLLRMESFIQGDKTKKIDNPFVPICEEEQGLCCSPWDHDMDDWWLHHPDWYVSRERADHFCFSRISNDRKAAFFRRVHDIQWNHDNNSCDQVLLANQSNSGYGASMNQIIYGFHAAYQRGVPFQISKHRQQMTWMFAPKNESSWAYCENKDMSCYFLPLSDCKATIGGYSQYIPTTPQTKQDVTEFQWLRIYAARPRQHVRQHVHDYITRVQGLPSLPWDHINCTAMHVRRGDSGFVVFPWRRWAAVQEYIDKAKIQPNDTIVLLSDDISTIEEVEKYHASNYNWIYLKRRRFRGTEGGINNHIPSGDQALEVVTIMAEVKLAAQCSKLVSGTSGFVAAIKDALEVAGTPYKQYTVLTRIKKDDIKKDKRLDASVRAKNMWDTIEAKNNKTAA